MTREARAHSLTHPPGPNMSSVDSPAPSLLFVMPGDPVDWPPVAANATSRKGLNVGPGLVLAAPGQVAPVVAGLLRRDGTRNSVWVEKARGRYVANTGDRVVATVVRSVAEAYVVQLSEHGVAATLPHMAFEQATKKTRPTLAAGALVYAHVARATRHADPELDCLDAGLGPLSGGMLFAVSLGMARRLLMPRAAEDAGLVVLDALEAAGLAFETAVGRNGRVWVDAPAPAVVVLVGRAIVQTDERQLDVQAQARLVRSLVASTQ